MLGALVERWEDKRTVEELKDSDKQVDLVTTSDYIRSQLTSFDPMCTQYPHPDDVDDEDIKVFKITRLQNSRIAANNVKTSILRELDAFDAALEQPAAKRARY